MQYLHSSDIYHHWVSQAMTKYRIQSGKPGSVFNREHTDTLAPLGLKHISVTLIILSVGCLIGFISCVLEIMCTRWKRSQFQVKMTVQIVFYHFILQCPCEAAIRKRHLLTNVMYSCNFGSHRKALN